MGGIETDGLGYLGRGTCLGVARGVEHKSGAGPGVIALGLVDCHLLHEAEIHMAALYSHAFLIVRQGKIFMV
ncbi:protein of unknown function [Pseudodesulfovibrio piezophilus C1TLV30]|uniref:Uncharacterized protein n=1 Tax=Pseudodesulfovibrio piezophilus (strain DSM 21447 / JCM 15486 / C1TLV30) TaxID=1322246 RepID=M1WT14_PSEP2|nr:protein of unknown function [Pseudodesulfovibrio piezophilus C1TLV30]